MLSKKQQITKRGFDIIFSFFGLVICVIPILLLVIIATFSTKRFGLFPQHVWVDMQNYLRYLR